MTNSRKGRGRSIPRAAVLPGLRVLTRSPSVADLLPHAAVDLESFLTKGALDNPGAPPSGETRAAQAREARRCAQEGGRLIRQGRPAQAIPLLERAVRLDPGVAPAHHGLGLALMAAGRPRQAAVAFAAALRLDPRYEIAHCNLGHAYESTFQDQKAMASYQAAIALKPDLVAAHARLGELYLEHGRRAEAAAAFRAAATATAGTRTARIAEARALEASGAFDEALVRDASRRRGASGACRRTRVPGRLLGVPVFRRRPPLL